MTSSQTRSVAELTEHIRRHDQAAHTTVRSVFHIEHGTRLGSGGPEDPVYRNRYVLARIGEAFGACAFEADTPGTDANTIAGYSGLDVSTLLGDEIPEPVRVAVVDAWLAQLKAHRDTDGAKTIVLPAGDPARRAVARDEAVIEALSPSSGQRIAVIGVVTPMVQLLLDSGVTPVLIDRNIDTCLSLDVDHDIDVEKLRRCDAVLATGMTVLGGAFDLLRRTCAEVDIPLTIYAQSAAAIVRSYLGYGVSSMTAEPFPFSQFSAEETRMYLYRAG